jgi:hypothetical protein
VVDPTREWQSWSGWSRKRAGAIGFLSCGEAEACYHARPAGVPLRPDGTPDWPSSACRVVFGYEPPGLSPVAQNPSIRASRNSSTWTKLSDPPTTTAGHLDGHSLQPPGLVADPVQPPGNLCTARAA